MKRGLTYAQAIEYTGVKRPTFDRDWKPRLVAMPQGNCQIYDRLDIDRLFDEFKREAANEPDLSQNAGRNGRPTTTKGVSKWANKRGASTPQKTGLTTSTSTGAGSAFSSAASRILTMQKGG